MLFTGTWSITIATPIGRQSVILEINEREGLIQGCATQGAEVSEFINPKLEDEHLVWTQQITKPMRLTLKFDVTIHEGKMSGTAKAGFLPSSALTGVRVVESR
jgi:hypothetical protein